MTAQAAFSIPQLLAENYRLQLIIDFVGSDKPKKILSTVAARQYPSAAASRPIPELHPGNGSSASIEPASMFASQGASSIWC
jgi:hypothetical protein